MEVCLLQNKHYVFLHFSGKRDLFMPCTCFILAFARLKQTNNKPALQVKAIWALESWKELDVKGLGIIY